MAHRIGIDVGGTFTDFLVVSDDGISRLHKVPSTPDDPSRAVLSGLRELMERHGIVPDQIGSITHGTTVATNSVLEGDGARVGLLCTRGFEHVLHLARAETPGPLSGWLTMIKPDPLAAVEDTRGIVERIGADGAVVTALDEQQARAAIDDLVGSGITSLAISLINSFACPDHELRLRELVHERDAEVSVSLSCEVLPEFREYERTNVVVMNAYIRPRLESYLNRLRDELRAMGIEAPLSVLRSDGGLMTIASASERPVMTLFSGPAGGVAGASRVATTAGYSNFLTLDVGGTSTDVALCLGGEPVLTRETTIGLFPLKSPAIDARSVGAGGGSIAHVPELTGALRVGPESAGAVPGPAAYGQGGQSPTVTDANLVLGLLPNSIAGGLSMDVEAARKAVGAIADALGVSVEAAAEGIIDIANESMVGALRLVSVEKGHDPRDFALVAFGGAGPLFGNALAELLGCHPVIVPPTPGVLAALGDVVSSSRSEFAETFIQRFDQVTPADVSERLTALAAKAERWLESEGVPAEEREVRFEVDVRYCNQALEIPVAVTPGLLDGDSPFRHIATEFASVHEREYGFRLDVEAEFVNLRAFALGRAAGDDVRTQPAANGAGPDAHVGVQRIYRRGEWIDADLYQRAGLRAGQVVSGPAIIVQQDSTTVVLPGSTATVDDAFNLVISIDEEPESERQGESPIVIDIVENALKNIRREMDAVIFRAAMSTVIREEHDSFPLLADGRGRMLAGQFGWPLEEFFASQYDLAELEPGDVLILNDPYLCGGAIQHTPDMLALRPIFYEGELVGFASQIGNLMDIGGPVAGSMPARSRSIFDEGIRFPPVKLYSRGELVQPIADILSRNSRTPEITLADTLALVAATRAAELRVIELCERFGVETYRRACDQLLDRTREAAKVMIQESIPETPLTFEDTVDDDGCGNGPFTIRLSLSREGERAVVDFDGSSPQAEGPINLFMGASMFKMVTGIVLIMALDPDILFNAGYNDLIDVRFPEGSIVQPRFPAPLSNRAHTLARVFDVLQGALAHQNPKLATGAACGSSPHLLYSGTRPDGDFFFLYEINYGGIPGRPVGDGMDVHAWWPHVTSIPAEYAESHFPVRIERIASRIDSGGPGLHRGGNGVDKTYVFLAEGEISVHDDRHVSRPWGIGGGRAAACSRKRLVRADGREEELPAKIDFVRVEPGDRLLYETAGGGGWGDPLQRDPEAVRGDVVRGFVSVEHARRGYGVVLDSASLAIDDRATAGLREELRANRPADAPLFDRGD